MEITWTTKKIGKCLTQYIRADYDQISSECDAFLVRSQFNDTPTEYAAHELEIDIPKIRAGQVLYGIDLNGVVHRLKAIIDSSD